MKLNFALLVHHYACYAEKNVQKEDAVSLFRKICSHLDLTVGLFLEDREYLWGRLCT